MTPDTQAIAFTGSVATGRRIAQLAAERVKVNLNGWRSLHILTTLIWSGRTRRGLGGVSKHGPVCTSGERFCVFDSVADKFIDRFVNSPACPGLGTLGADVDLGPRSRRHTEKVERNASGVQMGRCLAAEAPGNFAEAIISTYGRVNVDHLDAKRRLDQSRRS